MDLKANRLLLRLSQSELARLSGVTRFKICLHELGDKRLGERDEAAVKVALGRHANELRHSIDLAIDPKGKA